MPDIKLKGYSGEEKTYSSVEKVYLSAAQGDQKLPYTYGEAVSKTVEPDFAGGDMAVEIPAGELVTALTIQKPNTLVPENIAQGINIAGVMGAFAGSAGSGGNEVAEMPCLKYAIPIKQEAKKDSNGGLTLGTITIQRSPEEDVRVILIKAFPWRSWDGHDTPTVSYIEYEAVQDYINGQMHTQCIFSYMYAKQNLGGGCATGQKVEKNAESVSFTPIWSQSSGKIGISSEGPYYGFILVTDSKFFGKATIIHENNYVSSTLGITVM